MPSPTDLVGSAIMVGFRELRGGLEGLTEQYAANMEDDIDWAMDWQRADNAHSRLSNEWVGDSIEAGMRRGFQDGFDEAMDDATYGLWSGADGGDVPGTVELMANKVLSNAGQVVRGANKFRRQFMHSALNSADILWKQGMTKAGHALVKHPELLQKGIQRGPAAAAEVTRELKTLCAINSEGMRQVKQFETQGKMVRTGKHVEFWINGQAVRLRALDGQFDTFLTKLLD